MKQVMMKYAATLIALTALAGCDAKAPQPAATSTAATAPVLVPSASLVPSEVLIGWAKAVSMRDWPSARAYWGDKGAASGLSEQAFAQAWNGIKNPDVKLGVGQLEGAAGSSFYTAPVIIADGERRIAGFVVLRRVNDVPGATPEQLRWHIESSTLVP
jgi:hypothetical protein